SLQSRAVLPEKFLARDLRPRPWPGGRGLAHFGRREAGIGGKPPKRNPVPRRTRLEQQPTRLRHPCVLQPSTILLSSESPRERTGMMRYFRDVVAPVVKKRRYCKQSYLFQEIFWFSHPDWRNSRANGHRTTDLPAIPGVAAVEEGVVPEPDS